MEKERFFPTDDDDDRGWGYSRTGMIGSSPASRPAPVSSPPSAAAGGEKCILHTVTKFDTLAGVAIKYGVEVSDIKKLNGLMTDLQMFALKTLQIPPGRHPPSPTLSNGYETPTRPTSSHQSTSSRRHSDIFDTFPSLKLSASSEEKLSPAISTLRDFYDLKPTNNQKHLSEGFEMAVYRNGGAHYLENDQFSKSSSPISNSNPPFGLHRKSKSVANYLSSENSDFIDQLISQGPESNDSGEKLVRRRQKSVANFSMCTPEKVENKGLGLRPKSCNPTGPSPNPVGLGDSLVTNGCNGVRKTCSTPSLQDSENGSLLSLWPAFKPDFQALSTRPMFDGLPKPANWKNKAAID